ncbi:MAG TPA: hypothetical protein VHE53_04200 [Patescibacteria group bacterium]|nr:hypothetical protein [Patescibacteria group bacterium]
MESEHVFQPHPESPYWNRDLPSYIENRLNEVANKTEPEVEISLRTHQSPERVLYNRLVSLLSEEIADWNDESLQREYEDVVIAFGIIAFPNFNQLEKPIFVNRLKRYKESHEKEGEIVIGVSLTPEQSRLLKMVAQRINLPYDETRTNIPFWAVNMDDSI